jgi:hypothetical protein
MRARIFRQPKSAMQSGYAGTQDWVLEYEATGPRRADPLMGWIGGTDTRSQVRLIFPSADEAVAYAEQHELAFDLELPREKIFRPKAYADNFKFGRAENWTH